MRIEEGGRQTIERLVRVVSMALSLVQLVLVSLGYADTLIHPQKVFGLVGVAAFSPDASRIVTGGYLLSWWDAKTGEQIRTVGPDSGAVGDIAYSYDGTKVVGAHDTTATVWDAVSGAKIRTFSGHGGTNWVNAVALSPDGRKVLTGGGGDAKLWDVATGAAIQTFGGHSGLVVGIAFSPDGTKVLTGSADRAAQGGGG